MPELLLELLTEEIPARMQARAADDLCRLAKAALAPLLRGEPRGFHGPRRIGLVAELDAAAETAPREERGPRVGAPEQALAGFLKKHGAARRDLAEQNGFFVLVKPGERVAAEALLAERLPDLLWSFPWPKSMRWGVSQFLWVRPLQRILCVFDGRAVPFALARGGDAAHGIVAADLTEGHRVHAPGAVAARSAAQHERVLRERFSVTDAAERAGLIRDGLARLAAERGLSVVPDEGLLAEVAGLVEWPVPLLGRIDDAFMDLPAEVMRASMRVNQRYFSLCHPDGRPAPFFGLVANISPRDGGAALVAGNERVLRARLSDARFFWDQDRKARLEDFLPKLEGAVFHAKLGTQRQRVKRIERLARFLAPMVGADADDVALAARLAKADLASGMVGEFPELQGVMGGHYARAQGIKPEIADAIAQHYRPLGPSDEVPHEPVAVAVALADKLDQLAGFFAVGESPTGSGDPFALRRAALGVLRVIREADIRLSIRQTMNEALKAVVMSLADWASYEARRRVEPALADAQVGGAFYHEWRNPIEDPRPCVAELLDFLTERLRVQLRAEGARHDLVAASIGDDDDLLRILARADALKTLVESADGANLLAAYKRAQNILRIEGKKDGTDFAEAPDPALYEAPEEAALAAALDAAEPAARRALAAEDFPAATAALAALRAPLDAFFDKVVVNDPQPQRRLNRLRLLSRLRSAFDTVADLSKIEG